MDMSKAFGCIVLFLLIILSYTPLKEELVTIAGNSTLTNAGVVILNVVFGLIWILLAILFLCLAVFYALK